MTPRKPMAHLAVPVALFLLAVAPTASRAQVATSPDTVLPLLVARGHAPAAALLADGPSGTRYAHAEAEGRWPVATSATTSATATTTTSGDGNDGNDGRGVGSGGSEEPRGDTAEVGREGPPARQPEPLRRADHFRAGSITKTFIATVVLQLAAEHRLSLSDSVEDHLPGLVRGESGGRDDDGRRITLRALLTHTSGLADFTAATGGTTPVTPRQAVRLALSLPQAVPGRFFYSNTNYVLLGLVVEQVTGTSYAAEAEHRIIAPLRLTGTSFPGARSSLPDPHGRAYSADGSDVTDLDPRTAGAAGELVTTLPDVNRFYGALLGGDLLPPRQLREMLDTRAAHGAYGMGLYPVRLSCGTTVWGHNGRITGSYVRTAATADGRHVLTYRVNTDAPADPGLEPALLTAEFCPRALRSGIL
ncbi:serine hydrolase domain-containing protein [Streptomyces sp. HM190]|uniref:serine hydrolase domain-containing protein n=1 Tax=Streptomyces sp. HM190 TaxID=2695266 RepID=UPI00135CC7D8|nr:serine hydrolase domain-containing protein [Streptomyces sp. HM190]